MIAIGAGATILLPDWDLLLYVDVARWEIQQRQRRHEISSLGLENAGDRPSQLYKRAFFLDWRAADRHKNNLYECVDFWIDGNVPEQPAMLEGEVFRAALATVAQQPFRVVPFFDPGPWGGQWMREHFRLARWSCKLRVVLRLRTGRKQPGAAIRITRVRTARIDACASPVGEAPGGRIVESFGREFPIRFDFLDTMDGGNLSLQVHPLTSYIKEQFGQTYTQDESYYLLDAGPDAIVYLGLRQSVDKNKMTAALQAAQDGGPDFSRRAIRQCLACS